MNYQYTKEMILDLVGDYRILNHYLKPHHNRGDLKAGQLISNPFLFHKQKTPSFNIYNGINGWRYYDFATGDSGDCFSLVMKLFGLSFQHALDRIYYDFDLFF